MGADGSRLYSPSEESIDAYIDRGGARLVNRERSFTTSTTVDVGSGGNYTFRNVGSGPRLPSYAVFLMWISCCIK